jgi:hypothetical protein
MATGWWARSERQRLPNRRASLTLAHEYVGLPYVVTVSRDHRQRVKEVFIQSLKASSHADIAARESGVLLSLLLQHNCPSRR